MQSYVNLSFFPRPRLNESLLYLKNYLSNREKNLKEMQEFYVSTLNF